MLDGQRLTFLFWSVTGTANGPSVFFDRYQIVNIMPANNQDPVVATAIYAVPGEADHPGEYGYDVDAFDVNRGDFVDMDFVVAVEPNANLAQRANAEGFVPTVMMENIQAYSLIAGESFTNWRVWKEMDEDTVDDINLSASAGSNAIGIAFYMVFDQPHPVVSKPVIAYDERTTLLLNWIATHGNGDPPMGQFVHQLVSGLILTETASLFSPELRSPVLDLAAKQVSLASGLIKKEILAGKKVAVARTNQLSSA